MKTSMMFFVSFSKKGFNFLDLTQNDVNQVVDLINSRPRFCLGLRSPNEDIGCT